MKTYLDIGRLATMVRTQRGSRGLREVAEEIGSMSSSTLSRVENGRIPDMETFLRLCDWLCVAPAMFFHAAEGQMNADVDTAEAVAIRIRASKDLEPATANVLATLVKAAYRDLARQHTSSATNEKV